MTQADARIGRPAALLAAAAILAYGVVQLMQLAGLLAYPADEVAIYLASLLIAPPFLLAVLSAAAGGLESTRVWRGAATVFAGLYVGFALLVYVFQLGSVLPYAPTRPTHLLSMAPHSLFWTIDALAYLSMSLSCGFLAAGLPRCGETRAARGWLLAHAAVIPLISFAYFSPRFSPAVLLVGAPWLVTAPGAMLSLAGLFRSPGRGQTEPYQP